MALRERDILLPCGSERQGLPHPPSYRTALPELSVAEVMTLSVAWPCVQNLILELSITVHHVQLIFVGYRKRAGLIVYT